MLLPCHLFNTAEASSTASGAACTRWQALVRCLTSGMIPWGMARAQSYAGTTAEAVLLWCMRAEAERHSAPPAAAQSADALVLCWVQLLPRGPGLLCCHALILQLHSIAGLSVSRPSI